jgi:Cu(I)/Ag(I) efflux system periplasmic protein CusF
MKNSTLILTAALSLFAAHSFAQTAAPAAPATATTAPAPMVKDMAEAEVRKVDKDAKKVTLKHGPIKNLDMPSMTMVFQVRDEKLFDKLAAGEKIKFTAEQLQGAYVVTGVEKAETK